MGRLQCNFTEWCVSFYYFDSLSATILIVFIVTKVLWFYLCHHLLYEQITIYSVSYRYYYLARAEQIKIFYSGEMINDVGITCIHFVLDIILNK